MLKTAPSNGDIQSIVNDFTNQLTVLMNRSALEQVLAALGGEVGSVRGPARKRGRPLGSRNVPKVRGKRTTKAVAQMGERLLAYVKSQPGRRADQIAKVFHTDVKTIRLPMQRLIAARKISTKGQRRGTTYFPGAGAVRAKPSSRATRKSKSRTRKSPRRAAKSRSRGRKSTRTKKAVLRPQRKAAPAKPKTMIPKPRVAASPAPQVPSPAKTGSGATVTAGTAATAV